jgi:hypothetical protein
LDLGKGRVPQLYLGSREGLIFGTLGTKFMLYFLYCLVLFNDGNISSDKDIILNKCVTGKMFPLLITSQVIWFCLFFLVVKCRNIYLLLSLYERLLLLCRSSRNQGMLLDLVTYVGSYEMACAS